MFYQIIKVGKEAIGLVWSADGRNPKIERIYLPASKQNMLGQIQRDYPAVRKTPRRIPDGLDEIIAGLYEGKKLKFKVSCLNWVNLSDFSQKVMMAALKIPRGKVAAYSTLAAKAGAPCAARAVGAVMAHNPFPIVIPCHRVVRADGAVGQFGGGSAMKEHLLKKEGVVFAGGGKVSRERLEESF